jgi:hypothetical protein
MHVWCALIVSGIGSLIILGHVHFLTPTPSRSLACQWELLIDRFALVWTLMSLFSCSLPALWYIVCHGCMKLRGLCCVSLGKMPHFDTSKARAELGLDFFPVRKSAQDMAASLIALGIVPRLPGAPAQAKL